MREEHLIVPRHARYYARGPAEGATELWIACHGYGQLAASFLAQLSVLDDGTRLVAAPEGLSRFYLPGEGATPGATRVHGPAVAASWMTREDREHEIADQMSYLDLLRDVLRDRVAAGAPVSVLGFSQGAATASRWAIRARSRVRRLIIWGALLPPELASDDAVREKLAGTSVAMVRGDRDALVPAAAVEEQVAWLESLGLHTTLHTFPGGHRLDDDTLRAVAMG